MNKIIKILTVLIISVVFGLVSGMYLNEANAYMEVDCENFGCGYEPVNHEFRCWGIQGASGCDDSGSDCNDMNC